MRFLTLRPLPAGLGLLSPTALLALWGHSGRLRPASGTWGSLAATPFVLALLFYDGPVAVGLFALVMGLIGLWVIPAYVRLSAEKDPSEVVLDEVVGVALTYLPLVHFDFGGIAIGFAAFRLFDALKPGPIGWCDRRLPGAWGVMMDDVVAGVLAGFCVYGYERFV